MRHLALVVAGLALGAGLVVVAVDAIMAFLDAGAHLLAALLFALALGGLASCTVMALLLRIEDEPR